MIPISKKFDFNDPAILTVVRAVYVASNVLIAAVYLYIQLAINKKKGAWRDGMFFFHVLFLL
jgi:hypothetical protein